MELLPEVHVEVIPCDETDRLYEDDARGSESADFDFDRIIFDLDQKIDMLSSQADKVDLLVAAASGILCGALDIFWVGEFDLTRGREIASNKVENFVRKTAKVLGCKKDDLQSSVGFLEKNFPLASDGNTPGFGGGLQHHLRDFAHHPTVFGLAFSLLTQFTYKSYGTDKTGNFIILDVPEKSRAFIGNDIPKKILYGTVIWFFHLVSDMAGSAHTAVTTGGTGIPGPILSLAKEISAIPMFSEMKVGDNTLSVMLSKLFNGTLLAQHDANGKIIRDTVLKFDFRGELGAALEIGRQALPVIANDCIVRSFYMIRRLAMEIKRVSPHTLDEFRQISWDAVKPFGNPTITRMITVASGVFVTVDVGEAVVTQKYWVSVNYVGAGRFALAIGGEILEYLKVRKVKEIRSMYETIKQNTYTKADNNIYGRLGRDMDYDKLGLTLEEIEVLYNLEYYKTLNDIHRTKLPISMQKTVQLKTEWLEEWKKFISLGFKSFTQVQDAEIHWYSKEELLARIEKMEPQGTWFRLVLLEVMLFEPYYPLCLEKNKKGNDIPSTKYKILQNPLNGYKTGAGDLFLEEFFSGSYYYSEGYIKRLRKCYKLVLFELNKVLKNIIKAVAITTGITLVTVFTAGAFAPAIAVALVGSNFAGLSGAALTSACLAYLGGGAIAVGGAGMAGGTIAIVGGGAALGIGVGAGVGGAVGAAGISGKRNIIIQSAKLMVAVREIFLNDEKDLEYSGSILEQYVNYISEIEKGLVDLKLKADVAGGEEKKRMKVQIKNAEDTVEIMKIARKNLAKFISSFDIGINQE